MRLAAAALLLLGLGACSLNLPGRRTGDEQTGTPPVQAWQDAPPPGTPGQTPVIGPTTPTPTLPAALPDQPLEASVAGAPGLSGRFWA